MNYYLIYTKLPEALQAWLSRAIYKPRVGKHVELRGKTYFHGQVAIGDYTEINAHAYLANTIIGKYCSIGKGFRTIVVNHRIDLFTTKAIGCIYKKKYIDSNPKYRPYWEGRVIIENDVWIGEDVTVIAPWGGAITIGNGAVIGAGSIVTRDVPPYAVCAGSPAKIIRYRFDKKKAEALLEEKWWDWEESRIYSRYQREYESEEEHY